MSTDQMVESISALANDDLTTKQYKAVDLTNDGGEAKVAVVSAAGARAIGILYNKPDADQAATVAIEGIVKANYGGNITAGQELQADGDGDLIVASTSDYVVGIAMVSGEDGDVGLVLLKGIHVNAA